MAVDRELIGEFVDAAAQDQAKARRMLGEHPELLNARWRLGETALHFLAVESFTDAVRFLASLGADVNATNEFGATALIDVASLGNDLMAEVLLEFGADPNAASETNDNVLHCAVRSGNTRLVGLLLRAGARADYVTDLKETVFDALPSRPEEREAMTSILESHGIRRKGA